MKTVQLIVYISFLLLIFFSMSLLFVLGPPWEIIPNITLWGVCFWIILKSVATCLMCVTYASIVSVFLSKWNDLQAWNSCNLVLPIFEYCYLNKFCKPCQIMFIGGKDSYHNLASPTNVKQNLQTLMSSRKWCAFIQSLVLSKWASAFSLGFTEDFGLKYNQFKCTYCCPCCVGCRGCYTCCVESGWAWRTAGAEISGACSPASAILYLF